MHKFLSLLLATCSFCCIWGQESNYHFRLEDQVINTTGNTIPFWMRANQYGSVPLAGFSNSMIGNVYKTYDSSSKFFDWGFSLEGRANIGSRSGFILTEGYAKAKLAMFELRAGRSKEFMGLADSSLSSGSFAVSGNALGIPKVQISIPDYYTLPVLGKLFAFKGNFAHGWIGNVPIDYTNRKAGVNSVNTYFHQKSLYGRFGKPGWKLKLYGGFNHQAYWGNEQSYMYPVDFNITPWQAYMKVVLGSTYRTSSKVGDQLGSIDLGAEYDFTGVKILVYRQNIYDVGALYHLANIADGLNGISITNKSVKNQKISWHKIVFEVLSTKDQAGEPWSKKTPSGAENYYNSYIYTEGWTYKGMNLGTPFLTTAAYARSGMVTSPKDYFINNRVLLLHTGVEGAVCNWNYTFRLSYSKNYGDWSTSSYGRRIWGNHLIPPIYGVFKEVDQLSGYLELNKELKNNIRIGIVAAADAGKLYYNSFGTIIKCSKSF